MATKVTREMNCRHCGATWTIRDSAEDISLYINCCRACWEDDVPGMKRFEKMRKMMGDQWAIDHMSPA